MTYHKKSSKPIKIVVKTDRSNKKSSYTTLSRPSTRKRSRFFQSLVIIDSSVSPRQWSRPQKPHKGGSQGAWRVRYELWRRKGMACPSLRRERVWWRNCMSFLTFEIHVTCLRRGVVTDDRKLAASPRGWSLGVVPGEALPSHVLGSVILVPIMSAPLKICRVGGRPVCIRFSCKIPVEIPWFSAAFLCVWRFFPGVHDRFDSVTFVDCFLWKNSSLDTCLIYEYVCVL